MRISDWSSDVCSSDLPVPNKAPAAPPIVSMGASVPPEVPLPREIDQEISFKKQSINSTCMVASPEIAVEIFSYPTPRVLGAIYPTMPTAIAPNAGHHIQ